MIRGAPIAAAVFDLDGTLVHSMPDLAAAMNGLFEELGHARQAEECVARMIGAGSRQAVKNGLLANGYDVAVADAMIDEQALEDRFVALYGEILLDRTRPYDGVPACLGELRGAGLRLGVCTNKNADQSHRILEGLGLAPYFDVVVGGDTLPVKKPDPAPLLHALDALGADPRHGLMVGDSAADSGCAQEAGAACVLVRYGYTETPVDELPADARVASFSEIAGLVLNAHRFTCAG